VKTKMMVGPLRILYGGAGQGEVHPKSAIQSGGGYKLTHRVKRDRHRITIRDPHGRLMARVNLTHQEWKEFASAAPG
jgi:hypothetical protein